MTVRARFASRGTRRVRHITALWHLHGPATRAALLRKKPGFPRLVPLLAAALILTACESVDRPFSKTDNPALAQSRPPAPPIRLEALGDVPPSHAARLKAALASAIRRRGIRLSGSPSARWRLRGDFEPFRDASGRKLAYVFRLRGPSGRIVDEVSGTEKVPDRAGNPWAGIGSIAITRIAGTVAESISGKLAQLGYATQGAGLPPPASTLVQAGPGAEKELDPDLFAGLPPANGGLARPPALATPPARAAAPPSRPSTPRTRPAPPPVRRAAVADRRKPAGKSTSARGKVRISTVAVTGVTGAPGKGNAELARAMRKVLKGAGWPVFARPRRDSMTIAGRVSMGRPSSAGQKVRIAWTVKSPAGKVLGVIRQANTVPAGSLDAGFGPAARPVAEAAASGIFQLVRKLR